MELRDKHVFITGGSSGIGLSIARQAAKAGARLSLVARNSEKLTTAAAIIRAETPAAPNVFTFSADVSVESEVQAAVHAAEQFHGAVDILITSAGIANPGYFEDIPISVFQKTMAVNYFGTLYAVRAIVPSMRKKKDGSIVFVSSGAGLVGLFGYTPYSPTKFAVRGLAEALRSELKQTGVSVTIAYPPDTQTPQLIEENLTKPEETKAITSSGGVLSPDAVARQILAAVTKRRFTVSPGIQMTALLWFHSIVRPLLHWHFDRIVAATRNKAKER